MPKLLTQSSAAPTIPTPTSSTNKQSRCSSTYRTVNYVNANVPSTFEEAINSSDSHEWKKAMDSEIQCLSKNETWQVVEKPKEKKINLIIIFTIE